jgi:RimJ/RimL family protein N-acetyltransferase
MVGKRVSIRPYAGGDIWVLERTLGDSSQMVHLNGPESPEALRKRHEKFLALSSDPTAGCMFTITIGSENAPAGSVGYWETEWDGQKGWETGWFVLPEFQGKGIATTATRMMMDHVAEKSRRFLFAYPSVNNGPSNAVCRKLGFTLIGETESEYPPKSGRRLRVNVWRLGLKALGGTPPRLTLI